MSKKKCGKLFNIERSETKIKNRTSARNDGVGHFPLRSIRKHSEKWTSGFSFEATQNAEHFWNFEMYGRKLKNTIVYAGFFFSTFKQIKPKKKRVKNVRVSVYHHSYIRINVFCVCR